MQLSTDLLQVCATNYTLVNTRIQYLNKLSSRQTNFPLLKRVMYCIGSKPRVFSWQSQSQIDWNFNYSANESYGLYHCGPMV